MKNKQILKAIIFIMGGYLFLCSLVIIPAFLLGSLELLILLVLPTVVYLPMAFMDLDLQIKGQEPFSALKK